MKEEPQGDLKSLRPTCSLGRGDTWEELPRWGTDLGPPGYPEGHVRPGPCAPLRTEALRLADPLGLLLQLQHRQDIDHGVSCVRGGGGETGWLRTEPPPQISPPPWCSPLPVPAGRFHPLGLRRPCLVGPVGPQAGWRLPPFGGGLHVRQSPPFGRQQKHPMPTFTLARPNVLMAMKRLFVHACTLHTHTHMWCTSTHKHGHTPSRKEGRGHLWDAAGSEGGCPPVRYGGPPGCRVALAKWVLPHPDQAGKGRPQSDACKFLCQPLPRHGGHHKAPKLLETNQEGVPTSTPLRLGLDRPSGSTAPAHPQGKWCQGGRHIEG